MQEQVTGDQLIIFRFQNPMAGVWLFQVYGSGDLTSKFHVWLPIEEFITKDNFYLNPNPYTTITAPGVNLYCPTVGNQFVRSSGSSLAAAYTTGVVAMLFEWGIIRENLRPMNGVVVKRMLVNSAKRDPKIRYPNKEVGYGILDISSTFYLDMWIFL